MQARQQSRIGRQRLPFAESRVRASGCAFTIRICRIWRELSEHTATIASLRLDGASLAPITSLDLSRSNSRDGSDLHSPNDARTLQTHDTAISARNKRSVVAFPSERCLKPRSDRSLRFSPADRRDRLAACDIVHRHSRSARCRARSAGRVTGRSRPSVRRAKVGGECGGSQAANPGSGGEVS